MVLRRLRTATTRALFVCGLAALAFPPAQAQDASSLPPTGGPITLVGCFQHESDGHHGTVKDDDYVLVHPMIGLGTTAPDSTCTAMDDGRGVELKEKNKIKLDPAMVGRWVEITGTLEEIEGDHDRRELYVVSWRLLPVAEAVAAPEPTPRVALEPRSIPPPQEQPPVGTSGMTSEELPKTASTLPLIQLSAFLSLALAVVLHLFQRHTNEG